MLSPYQRARLLATFALEPRPLELVVPRDLEVCAGILREKFDPFPDHFLPVDLMQFKSLDDNTYSFVLQAYRYFPHVLITARLQRQDARHTHIEGETVIAHFGLFILMGLVTVTIGYLVLIAFTPIFWLNALFTMIAVVLFWIFLRYSRRRIIRLLTNAMIKPG